MQSYRRKMTLAWLFVALVYNNCRDRAYALRRNRSAMLACYGFSEIISTIYDERLAFSLYAGYNKEKAKGWL